jgi:hypothetical protein
MSYHAGDSYVGLIYIYDASGNSVDADVNTTPTAVLYRNGTVDGSVTVAVTHVKTGVYKATAALPSSYSARDVIHTEGTATQNSVTASFPIDSFTLETDYGVTVQVSDSNPTTGGFGISGTPSGVASNYYAGKTLYVLDSPSGGFSAPVGFSAPITASTNTTPVRLTLGSGFTVAPPNGSTLWIR